MAIDGNYDNPDRARRLEKERDTLRAENAALKSEVAELLAICDGTQSMLTQAEHEVERLKARLERVEAAAREVRKLADALEAGGLGALARGVRDTLAALDDETKGVG